MKIAKLSVVAKVFGLFPLLLTASVAWAGEAAPASMPMIRIGHVGHDHHLALYVAALESESRKEAWGIYLRPLKPKEVYEMVEGDKTIARLQFIQTDGGSAMPAAMSRGEFEIGLGGTIAVAKLADAGQPLKIIAPLQTDGDQLVWRKGGGVTNWPSFLAEARKTARPLKIGYKEPMAVAKMIFERALKAEGIPYGLDENGSPGVVLINFGSEKSPLPLMESGVLDGFVMNQPGTAMAVHKGLAQVVADLRDLPPNGKWLNHPCCCVAATEASLKAHPEQIKAILKLLALSTQLIREDQRLAVDCAVRWTKNPQAVEAQSVPTVNYVARPTEDWIAGMKTWWEMVKAVNFFKGKYAQVTADAFVEDLCSLQLCQAAENELKAKGQSKAQ